MQHRVEFLSVLISVTSFIELDTALLYNMPIVSQYCGQDYTKGVTP